MVRKGIQRMLEKPQLIGRFVYALYKVNNSSRIHEVIRESIEAKTAEIEDVENEEVEENWTENDKKELIEEYTKENNYYKTMIGRIKSGYVPDLEFETDYIGGAIYLVVKDIIILNMNNKKIRLSNMMVESFRYRSLVLHGYISILFRGHFLYSKYVVK